MSEFVPKTTGDLDNPDADNEAEVMEGFTPKKQDLESQSDAGEDASDSTFKKLQSESLPATSSSDSEPLKNIQVPATKGENPDEESGESDHHPRVNVVRDGDKITQIIVECKCGKTIPLDCLY